jgi:hypothetical protein
LAAAIGVVADDDDDGNEASGKKLNVNGTAKPIALHQEPVVATPAAKPATSTEQWDAMAAQVPEIKTLSDLWRWGSSQGYSSTALAETIGKKPAMVMMEDVPAIIEAVRKAPKTTK